MFRIVCGYENRSQVAHAICDFIFTTIVRAYGFPPYGLFYAEGWLRRAGFSKAVNMVRAELGKPY